MTDGFGLTASRDELAKMPARPVMPRTDAGWVAVVGSSGRITTTNSIVTGFGAR